MALVDVLKGNREKAIDDRVIEFAENMEYTIIESSKNGYTGYRYQIHSHDPDKHMMCSQSFAEKVKELMDGVMVKYEVVERKSLLTGKLFYEHYLHFRWND